MSKKADAEQSTDTLAPLTRGHKKKERTRQGLLDAALRVFARKDVLETGLLELAEEAQVSTGTIYNYFRTREEVAEAVGIAMASEFSEDISRLSAGIDNGAQRVAIGVRMFILRAIADPDWASALVRIVHFDKGLRSKLAMHVQADLRSGAEQGHLSFADESVALDLVIACATGGMRSAIEGRAVEQHDEKVAEMVLKALGATPAKARKLATHPLPRAGE
ncbi:TetR/AcrR family transcriptional regulator [Pseudomonas gingeri]|uniref:TetR/AcrR family transcriptional regulator n=1 Tax=Pseudomonas gingeri TaxID=117681 RepID=UPI0015A2869C|nr:TetR/AcrR family transcriptional regulator [Pseudomonas gingeri]NVZ60558.1 TetR/AcrR family transcriptional regulator [Pseudomonas gingeri]NVZ73373.1 TetR/AcrR family transcriptional regulator [Pseudomonas gingeri]